MLNKNLDNKNITLLEYLVQDNMIDADTAHMVLQKSLRLKISITSYLVRHNILSAETILEYCATKFKIPVFDLITYDSNSIPKDLIKTELIFRYHVLPLSKTQNTLSLGMSDPTDQIAITAIAFHTGLNIRPYLLTVDAIDRMIKMHFQHNSLASQLESTLAKMSFNDKKVQIEDEEDNDEPIIELVDRLIQDGIVKRSSDIHIEPYAQYCRIRFRCDGVLIHTTNLPLPLALRVITRLKVMAHLNIAERRLPQDGRLHFDNGAHINIRISCCPTLFGEKVVLRLLETKFDLKIDQLGFTISQKELFLTSIQKPQGLILVTGPTGSGKTITLYTALQYLNRIEKNICSVEDPIEIELNGINQVNVNPTIGLSWEAALRAFLRQDPDILMVGEIRDKETALIAIEAAQTGHLVLSTLHTNDAADTLIRLQTIGVSKDHIVNSLSLIIAQRLLRKLCDHCKQRDLLNQVHFHSYLSKYKKKEFIIYKASQCHHCRDGYNGRTAIFELLPITQDLTQLLQTNLNTSQMIVAIQQETQSLWEAGLDKVINGITSYTEVLRVVGAR